MNYTDSLESIQAQGGGYPPGGYGPPGGGGYGPPGAPPPGGWGPPGAPPPGGGGPPGSPPGGYGPPGAPPPGGYGPPGSPPGYGPPGGGYGPPGGGPPYGGGFAPPPYQPGGPPPPPGPGFEATEAFAFAWAAVTKDYAGVAVPLVVAAFVAAIPGAVLSFVRTAAVAGLTTSGSVDQSLLMLVNVGGVAVSYLVGLVTNAFILGGVMQFSLRVARGGKSDFGLVFAGGRFFAPMLGATLVYGVCVFVGFGACFVPGLLLFAVWGAYPSFIVDKGLGGIEALKASWAATTPYRVNVIVYALLSMLVYIAGGLACCIGALLMSFPLLMIGNAYVYLKLIGEQPRLPGA